LIRRTPWALRPDADAVHRHADHLARSVMIIMASCSCTVWAATTRPLRSAGLHGDDALAAAVLAAVLLELGALAVAVLEMTEQGGVGLDHLDADHRVVLASRSMPHTPTVSRPWSRTRILGEADAHAIRG
jgi:hypothetical protein